MEILPPEWRLADQDTFLAEIVRHDDLIVDVENLDATDERIAQIAAGRLTYELRTLYRWWELP